MLLAVRYLAADGVGHLHVVGVGRAAAHAFGQPLEEGDALGGLREEEDGAREVEQVELLLAFDDQRGLLDLAGEPHHLGVAPLAEDDHLSADGAHLLVRPHDALLQPGHHRTGGVDEFDAQPLCFAVGGRRLAVGADEEPPARQAGHLLVGDGPQPQLFEPLHLDAVVDDIAQRIDRAAPGEGLFGLRDCPDHSEAESRFVVDFDVHGMRGVVPPSGAVLRGGSIAWRRAGGGAVP